MEEEEEEEEEEWGARAARCRASASPGSVKV